MRNEPQSEAVFDCNIYLQAAARPFSPSAVCLRLVEAGLVRLYVSEDILVEISDVLQRPSIQKRFPELTAESIEGFIDSIRRIAKIVKNIPARFTFPRDVDDEIYINLAVAAKVDFLVSRDKDLLDLMTGYTDACKEFRRRFRWLRVVGPVEFLNELKEQESNSVLG